MNKINIALGSGFFAAFFVTNGLAALAIPYYQMVLAVDPFWLGCILTLPVLISAYLSPLIGRLLDQKFASVASRSLVLKVSGWSCAMAFSAIWMVPQGLPTDWVLIYLFVFATVFFIAATVLNIVVRTLAFRSIQQSSDTNKVMAYTNYFEKFGSLVYFWMFPIAQSSLFSSLVIGIKVVGITVGAVLIGVLSHICSVFSISIKQQEHTEVQPRRSEPLAAQVSERLNLVLLMTLLQFGLIGCVLFFDFYLVVYFMFNGDVSAGAFWKGVMSTAYAVVGLITIPLVRKLAERFGLMLTLMGIYLLNVINGGLKWWIFQPGHQWWLLADAALGAWVWTAMGTLVPALLVSLSKHNKQQKGISQEAQIFAKHNKYIYLGVFFSFLISGLLLKELGGSSGFSMTNNAYAIEFMRVLLAWGSVIGSVIILAVLGLLQRKLKQTSNNDL